MSRITGWSASALKGANGPIQGYLFIESYQGVLSVPLLLRSKVLRLSKTQKQFRPIGYDGAVITAD